MWNPKLTAMASRFEQLLYPYCEVYFYNGARDMTQREEDTLLVPTASNLKLYFEFLIAHLEEDDSGGYRSLRSAYSEAKRIISLLFPGCVFVSTVRYDEIAWSADATLSRMIDIMSLMISELI